MIKILCVGKIKESYLDDLINDYKKRIGKYIKIEIIELKDDINYDKEINNLIKNIKTSDYNIGLDLKGKMYSSAEFADKIDKILPQNSNITFIIGGSLGLNDEVRSLCDELISFSQMTFPHGLFRGILLEQIYRVCKINNHEMYHK
ncbi:MAG: 23S rRNA (pseudouridine(1915)-N(3))-methyltransferase RlmH [Bacilli bacterium]|jgi:23S rRNA (pseudouridine1915-N3)-methyltransferase